MLTDTQAGGGATLSGPALGKGAPAQARGAEARPRGEGAFSAILAETGTDSLADVLETLVGAEMPTVYAGRQRGEEE